MKYTQWNVIYSTTENGIIHTCINFDGKYKIKFLCRICGLIFEKNNIVY